LTQNEETADLFSGVLGMVGGDRKDTERWRWEDRKEFLDGLESYSNNETSMLKIDIAMLNVILTF
jgi:hypothetical protein